MYHLSIHPAIVTSIMTCGQQVDMSKDSAELEPRFDANGELIVRYRINAGEANNYLIKGFWLLIMYFFSRL